MKLQTRLVAVAVAVSLLPAILASAILVHGITGAGGASTSQALGEQLASLRDAKKLEVESFLQSRLAAVQALAHNPSLVESFGAFKRGVAALPVELDLLSEEGKPRLDGYRAALSRFYGKAFADDYAQHHRTATAKPPEFLAQSDVAEIALQAIFIADNPNSIGQKAKLLNPGPLSGYTSAHGSHHAWLESAQRAFGFADLLLIDADTGRVVYSVQKNPDFGHLVGKEPLAGTVLAQAYAAALKAPDTAGPVLTDFIPYPAAGGVPAAYVATAVVQGGRRVAILAAQISSESLNGPGRPDKRWREAALGRSGEVYLVAKDRSMRSDSRLLIENRAAFQQALGNSLSKEVRDAMNRSGSSFGLLKIDSAAAQAALKGESGIQPSRGYLGNPVLTAYAPLRFAGLDWAVLAERDLADGESGAQNLLAPEFLLRALIAALIALAGCVIFVVLLRKSMLPLNDLQAAATRAAAGDMAIRAEAGASGDFGELSGAINKLLEDRVATLRRVETENDHLNNSVVGLLQAVFKMSQKDLTAKAPVTDDLVGTVASSINQFAEETGRVLKQVSIVASKVRQASTTVHAHADKVSKSAAEERIAVDQMTQNLGNAVATLNRVAGLASDSNTGAEQASQSTVRALETVNGTLESMELIRTTISETEKRIKRLGERSQEISGIVNLINNIAERTQVLALNASMQAASAGDAGRGFAVVAEEVQRLAESARQATAQISTLVGNIQAETREAINTVNRTISQVVAGSEQAQKAGEQMRATQEITFNLVQSVKRIHLSANTQIEIA
ncbi:MAG: methyl-accepting chemotaxis protein, partial [Betaproteobacteria bacterium]|nr:methyl-accepting chemotaxis protein [Betaproteobacteria bacterium]